MATIYGLHGPDGRVRYVGSTVNAPHRLRQHRHAAFQPASHEYSLEKSRWIREIGRNAVELRALEVVPDEIRTPMEREWIRNLIEAGFNLFNLHDTPDASARLYESLDHRRTPEARLAQSTVAQRHLRTPESVAKVAAMVRSPERRAAASRQMTGERHNLAKLTDANVREMLARGKDAGYKEIASRYGVSHHCIKDVFAGRTWRHIERCTP